MYYQPAFLDACWSEYLSVHNVEEGDVDPDAFVRWTYARALAHRQPLYAAMADRWGVTITAEDVAGIDSPAGFDTLIARALEQRR